LLHNIVLSKGADIEGDTLSISDPNFIIANDYRLIGLIGA
jgi:hypothetical protein